MTLCGTAPSKSRPQPTYPAAHSGQVLRSRVRAMRLRRRPLASGINVIAMRTTLLLAVLIATAPTLAAPPPHGRRGPLPPPAFDPSECPKYVYKATPFPELVQYIDHPRGVSFEAFRVNDHRAKKTPSGAIEDVTSSSFFHGLPILERRRFTDSVLVAQLLRVVTAPANYGGCAMGCIQSGFAVRIVTPEGTRDLIICLHCDISISHRTSRAIATSSAIMAHRNFERSTKRCSATEGTPLANCSQQAIRGRSWPGASEPRASAGGRGLLDRHVRAAHRSAKER